MLPPSLRQMVQSGNTLSHANPIHSKNHCAEALGGKTSTPPLHSLAFFATVLSGMIGPDMQLVVFDALQHHGVRASLQRHSLFIVHKSFARSIMFNAGGGFSLFSVFLPGVTDGVNV